MLYVSVPPLAPPPPIQQRLARSWSLWLDLASRDWHASFRRVWKTVIFIGRYCAQPIEHVERWPLSKVVRTAKLTVEYLEDENKKGAMPRNLSPRSGAW